jgi:flavin reductase (DIM6/NTAB) family NADH-FMN oxidoreductase RutF
LPIDPTTEEYRAAVGRFATGVTVVTARIGRAFHGMTASSFTSVSLDPLLVLVCVQKEAVMHTMLEKAAPFAVSVLAADQEHLARYFSDSGRPQGIAQFRLVAFREGPVTGAPLLEGALAHLECRLECGYDGGDHSVFLGRVLSVEVGRDVDPLLYYAGEYRRFSDHQAPTGLRVVE